MQMGLIRLSQLSNGSVNKRSNLRLRLRRSTTATTEASSAISIHFQSVTVSQKIAVVQNEVKNVEEWGK